MEIKVPEYSRLVNLTESIRPKRGLNMTKTDKPYLLEHDRKMTTTNINLLSLTESLTESDWIWSKEKNILNLTKTTKIHDWSWPNEKKINISTTTKIHFSVKFIRSYWIGQVNNPRIFWMNKIGIIEIVILKRFTFFFLILVF